VDPDGRQRHSERSASKIAVCRRLNEGGDPVSPGPPPYCKRTIRSTVLLPKLEHGGVGGAVAQAEEDAAAGSCPRARRLPDVGVLVRSSVISQAATPAATAAITSPWQITPRLLAEAMDGDSERAKRIFEAMMKLEPVVLGGAAVLVLGASLLAAWIPARRALHVDPASILTWD
jgi:hypothetical protein